MKRGEVWTLRDDRYASKARPVVVVQSDDAEFDSVILCLFTSFDRAGSSTRVLVEPAEENGLAVTSYVMTDKIVTVKRSELGGPIGILSDEQMRAVSRALAQILAITPLEFG